MCALGLLGFFMLAVFGTITLMLFAACRQNRVDASSDDITVGAAANSGSTIVGTSGNAAHEPGNKVNYIRPEIPTVISDSKQRASYYVKHYWSGYSLTDTAFIHSNHTEQLYADFIDALQYAAPEARSSALRAMMNHAEADSTAYTRFWTLSEKYLYDPNSPMRNEDYYISILEQMLASTRLSEIDKLRPADQLKQALKNRPGMMAPDFTYVTPEHRKGSGSNSTICRLHQFRADYTLLFFYDPDCSNCRKYEQELSEISTFLDMQEKNILRVLAIYTDDDENEWLRKSPTMPRGWVVGWNKQGDIHNKTLYEIRATPTMYLLDKQKKVILKDASIEQIIQYLSTVYSQLTE